MKTHIKEKSQQKALATFSKNSESTKYDISQLLAVSPLILVV